MQTFSMRIIFAFLAAAMLATAPPASALGNVVEPEADEVPGTTGGIPPPPGESEPVTPPPSSAPGSNTVRPSPPEAAAECRPASQNCPVVDPNEDEVIVTDDLPLGSTVKRGNGQVIDESGYPTSVGTGSAGSGVTGTPTGPAGVTGTPGDPGESGPVTGIGR